jgi:outer membrane protein assembly factor BamE (lipoprotein component of BamABCDE complex)
MGMDRMLKNCFMSLESIIILSCVVLITIGCAQKPYIPVTESKPKESSKIISPDDFNELIVGKTKIEVKEIMGGPPDTVMQNFETNDPSGQWGYMKYMHGRENITAKGRIIYDPITSKDPKMLIIIFKNEKAEKTMITY